MSNFATGALLDTDVNSIHYKGILSESHFPALARELYESRASDGLYGALGALQTCFTTYGGDDEFTLTIFEAIVREAKRVLKFVEPHVDAWHDELDARTFGD